MSIEQDDVVCLNEIGGLEAKNAFAQRGPNFCVFLDAAQFDRSGVSHIGPHPIYISLSILIRTDGPFHMSLKG